MADATKSTGPAQPEVTQFRISVLLVDDQLIIIEAIRRMLGDQPDIEFHFCSSAEQALATAERLRLALTASLARVLPAMSVTASFGVTQHVPGETAQNLLQRADSLLYEAKAAGRNRTLPAL